MKYLTTVLHTFKILSIYLSTLQILYIHIEINCSNTVSLKPCIFEDIVNYLSEQHGTHFIVEL